MANRKTVSRTATTTASAIIRLSRSINLPLWNAALRARETFAAPRMGSVLKPDKARSQDMILRIYFRADAGFTDLAGSWTKPRRVIAKVDWHSGELYPRAGGTRAARRS
jgi:hypothetical protein